jgi:hypothetical protein
MLNRMQCYLDPPNRINARIWVVAVRDSAGSLIGSIVRKELATEDRPKGASLFRFDDAGGGKLGEVRAPPADRAQILDVLGPSGQLRARLRGTSCTAPASGPVKVGPITLEDASGRAIAISEAFEHGPEGRFGQLRAKGLNIRSPDGKNVVVLKGAISSPGLKVDLCSSTMDRLAILALVAAVVIDPLSD